MHPQPQQPQFNPPYEFIPHRRSDLTVVDLDDRIEVSVTAAIWPDMILGRWFYKFGEKVVEWFLTGLMLIILFSIGFWFLTIYSRPPHEVTALNESKDTLYSILKYTVIYIFVGGFLLLAIQSTAKKFGFRFSSKLSPTAKLVFMNTGDIHVSGFQEAPYTTRASDIAAFEAIMDPRKVSNEIAQIIDRQPLSEKQEYNRMRLAKSSFVASRLMSGQIVPWLNTNYAEIEVTEIVAALNTALDATKRISNSAA